MRDRVLAGGWKPPHRMGEMEPDGSMVQPRVIDPAVVVAVSVPVEFEPVPRAVACDVDIVGLEVDALARLLG
jgi:hypothetical protein